jgi:putative PLP-dependent aminotransferase (TIGR04422 family)
MIDYQWPYQIVQPTAFYKRHNQSKRILDIIQKIEIFFEDLLNASVLLMPSGRSAMSLILSLQGINRSDVIFAPKWSSHCVWDILGRYANPTIHLTDDVTAILSVHKWGRIEKLSQLYATPLIIEDSVDSLFLDSTSLFPNGGNYEILSLPKIIGAYSGGILIFKDRSHKERALKFIDANSNLKYSNYQAQLKYNNAIGKPDWFNEWGNMEFQNFKISDHEAENIHKCLVNYELNKSTIQRRIEKLSYRGSIERYYESANKRLPPVITIPLENWKNTEGVMIRNTNESVCLDKPKFIEKGLMPLHFGVGENFFESLFEKISFL